MPDLPLRQGLGRVEIDAAVHIGESATQLLDGQPGIGIGGIAPGVIHLREQAVSAIGVLGRRDDECGAVPGSGPGEFGQALRSGDDVPVRRLRVLFRQSSRDGGGQGNRIRYISARHDQLPAKAAVLLAHLGRVQPSVVMRFGRTVGRIRLQSVGDVPCLRGVVATHVPVVREPSVRCAEPGGGMREDGTVAQVIDESPTIGAAAAGCRQRGPHPLDNRPGFRQRPQSILRRSELLRRPAADAVVVLGWYLLVGVTRGPDKVGHSAHVVAVEGRVARIYVDRSQRHACFVQIPEQGGAIGCSLAAVAVDDDRELTSASCGNALCPAGEFPVEIVDRHVVDICLHRVETANEQQGHTGCAGGFDEQAGALQPHPIRVFRIADDDCCRHIRHRFGNRAILPRPTGAGDMSGQFEQRPACRNEPQWSRLGRNTDALSARYRLLERDSAGHSAESAGTGPTGEIVGEHLLVRNVIHKFPDQDDFVESRLSRADLPQPIDPFRISLHRPRKTNRSHVVVQFTDSGQQLEIVLEILQRTQRRKRVRTTGLRCDKFPKLLCESSHFPTRHIVHHGAVGEPARRKRTLQCGDVLADAAPEFTE
ncbi:hypothetical protein B7C42_08134 [Nocardia cerradoensis]|uniref:Uncharacterized protein n=1 Tax=Nocardia cerradoensis TaxID=85688 RepID=A0A231GT40_9NOCA|nr:hypothetical protein B7C42_08134 [Nocardia cerradoensis]